MQCTIRRPFDPLCLMVLCILAIVPQHPQQCSIKSAGVTPTSDCEGTAATALANDGTSLERKASNGSTGVTMAVGGTDAANGNGNDTDNNNYDFVTRSSPLSQSSTSVAETASGGSFGGSGTGFQPLNTRRFSTRPAAQPLISLPA